VRVTFDKAAKTLTITDNGIGMSEQEAIDHLGTIAKSGTKDFMGKLSATRRRTPSSSASSAWAFTRASSWPTRSPWNRAARACRPSEGVRWVSGGTGDFEVETITRPSAAPASSCTCATTPRNTSTPGSSSRSSANTPTTSACPS
jgi:molecular chaperone HtpG